MNLTNLEYNAEKLTWDGAGGKFLNASVMKESINFVLSHFQSPLDEFPRKIMTFNYGGQFSVNSLDDILEIYGKAKFKDCRVNAYPTTIEKDGILIQPPNFIFIDLDLSNFGNDIKKFTKVKDRILKKIEAQGAYPTVIWTGNGYHIYIPLEIPVLDHIKSLSKDKFPHIFSKKSKYHNYYVSEVFLQFAEQYFTNGNADPNHHPKFKTCLIRIPGTYNTKCLENGKSLEQSRVSIIQKWNGKRVKTEKLLQDFRIWLIQLEFNLQKKYSKISKFDSDKNFFKYSSNRKTRNNFAIKSNSTIKWIENLLETPVEDNRKYCLWRIVAPYLLNIKQLSEVEAAKVMELWLEKCNTMKKLNFEPRNKIYEAIKYDKGFLPISKNKLKEENNLIFNIVRIISK